MREEAVPKQGIFAGMTHIEQAPLLIESQGRKMVAYTGANTEEGPSVYFYDLLTR